MSLLRDFYVIKLEQNFLTSLFCRFTLAPISLIKCAVLWASFIFHSPTGSSGCRWGELDSRSGSRRSCSGRWAPERGSSSVSGRRAVRCHTSTRRCSSSLFPAQTPRRIKQLSSSGSTWVRKKATYGLSTLCTSARMMEGGTDLFSQRHPDKDGDWEGTEIGIRCFSLSRFASLLFCIDLLFLFCFCFYSPSCVGEREMFAELLCGAVALVLYVNTLGADFCYDDRYLGEWMTSSPSRYYQHCLHHISPSVRVLSKAILMCSHSSCCHNSQWTASATATFNSRELSFFINTSSLPEGKCQFINRVYGALKSRGVIAMSSWLFVLM